MQDRGGVTDPAPQDFPPASERVTQTPNPYETTFVDEREVMRVTYQGDDRCQLACPGCYTAPRLTIPVRDVLEAGRRKVAPVEDFRDHLAAIGPGLQDVYLIGAEPTMDPAGSTAKLAYANEHGWPQMACTNGAVSIDRFEATFGEALDSGGLYMLVISLDSIDEQVNNKLRGRSFAHGRTMQIIDHCVARNAPFKVQMTVWAQNYPTIMETVHALYSRGVRGFSFHSGTLEGAGAGPDGPDRLDLAPLDPLAWRALVEQLYRFRDAHRENLWHFNIPFLFFTEAELRAHVIGDDRLTDAYLDHVRRLEAGLPSTKPVHACPALDVPQAYLYGNDGDTGRGALSACQIHTPPGAVTFADYNPDLARFEIIADPARNQLQQMADSPHLCPATATDALRWRSDRVATDAGDLFHACRFIASNQMPYQRGQSGDEIYHDALTYCAAVTAAITAYAGGSERPMARVRSVTAGVLRLADRATKLNADVRRHTASRQAPDNEVDAVHAR